MMAYAIYDIFHHFILSIVTIVYSIEKKAFSQSWIKAHIFKFFFIKLDATDIERFTPCIITYTMLSSKGEFTLW